MLKNKLKLFFFILTTTNLFVENKNKILIKEETLSQEKFKVFRIYAKSWEDVKAVGELRKVSQESQEIDFWLDSSVQPGQFADVMVSPSGMLFFEKFLKEHSSLNTEITVNDVQNLIIKNELLPKLKWRRQKNLKKERRKEKNEENSKFHRSRRSDFLQNKFDQLRGVQYPFGEYTNYNEMVRYMRTLEFYYPHLVQLLQIGTTHEGRSIEGVKIGISSINNFNKENDQNKTIEKTKKAFWIDGNMHAREWASSHTALFIINQLISSYGKDPFLTKALEEIDFFIIPCANPDGFEFSRGVDLNRNFDFHWAETGSSLNACSNLYSGKRAFSEPESRAISDFLKNNNEEDGEKRFYAFMTLHTYAQMWIHPFSHEYNTYPSDAEDLKNVALRATERLEKIYGTHYRVGTGADLLAPASGGSDDWAKETLGIKYVYLVELRPKLELSNGFILNQEELLDTAVETFEAIKEVIKAVMSESSFNVKNTTESNINLINDTLKLDDNEEERINSSTSVNELKQYMENNITFGSLLGEISKLETKESQLETTMTSVKQVEEKKEFEQYTQHTTETFDFIFRIEGEEAKEGGDEIKRLKENINNSNINFPSTSTQQVLFPLFNNSNSSAFENEQKTEDVDISKLTISLPFTVNGKIENIEETASSTSSSSTSTSSSKESETSLLTLNSIFEEDSTQSSSIAEDKISSETTSTSSTTTSSSTTLKSATISFGSRIESMSKSINTTTTSSSTSTSSSSTSRSTFSSLSSNMITLPTLLTSKKYPIEFVSFDEKKIELKPLIKKYLNFKSTTKSISFPIFDNDIEIDKENEGENDKITTEKIGKTELIEETKTEQKKELEQFKQYNQTTFSSLAETTTISTILESEKINKSTILPHLWMKTQKIFTLPWVQTRRLSLAKLLRIQKIPILSTKSTTTTPNNNLLLTKSTITKPPSTMLFTAVDEISEKGKQEFGKLFLGILLLISPPQLISPPLSPRLYLAPRFLGNAFSGSYEDDFCCLHKIGNDGQIKGISLKGVSAINLIKSVLLEEKTTKIPTSTSTTTLTTINDEIVQIMPKKCSDKKSSCAFWIRAHSPVCTEQHNFMERNCAFSCGFCY